MKKFILLSLLLVSLSFSEDPFQNFEDTVGYLVIEKGGRIERYVVIQNKDGSVKTIKVDKNPSQFLRKVEESKEGGKK